MDLKKELEKLNSEINEVFGNFENLDELEKARVGYLGKNGKIQAIFKQMGQIDSQERPIIGRQTNELKQKAQKLHQQQEEKLKKKEQQKKLAAEKIDVTLPGRKPEIGYRHPLSRILKEIEAIFLGLGFSIAEGTEIENEYYNFEALNIPKNHPARDLQDTLYINNNYLLRTHTSPVQIRTMEDQEPPIRIIAPGRVYRADELDASHSPVFQQIEGLVIAKDISFSDLKGTIETFIKELYGSRRSVRFRPSYFPFTEPSAEVDVSCIVCGGDGCSLCSQTGWLEVMGAGMVHPNVLEMSGYNPEQYSGFAFGMGWDRIAMLKYGINDIRVMFTNDQRFLHQF